MTRTAESYAVRHVEDVVCHVMSNKIVHGKDMVWLDEHCTVVVVAGFGRAHLAGIFVSSEDGLAPVFPSSAILELIVGGRYPTTPHWVILTRHVWSSLTKPIPNRVATLGRGD